MAASNQAGHDVVVNVVVAVVAVVNVVVIVAAAEAKLSYFILIKISHQSIQTLQDFSLEAMEDAEALINDEARYLM